MANDENLIRITKETAAELGAKGGKAKKGKKHINTWIQELLEDKKFTAKVRIGYEIQDFNGAPIEAIIKAQMIKAIEGDTKAFDSLAKYGWSQKVESENTHKFVKPIMNLEELTDAIPGNDSDQEG